MILKFRTGKIGLIILIMVISSSSVSILKNDGKMGNTASAALIEFPSYADIDWDASPLEKPLSIDVAITIPIDIRYWTKIPSIFSKGYPFNYFFLFGSPIAPTQKLHVEVPDPPTWADVYISSPDIYATRIPFDGDQPETISTSLVLSPRIEAPAQSYKIDIVVSAEDLGKVTGLTYQESISFTPSFIPTIQIETQNPVRRVAPHEEVNFEIKILNLGNKVTRVTPTLNIQSSEKSKWSTRINPPNYEIPTNGEATFTFSVIAPYDFGWQDYYGNFQIDFEAEAYPYTSGSANSTESIYLTVNNYGFYVPGFESVALIMAFVIVLVGIIVGKKFKDR
jgi:hypothetical protein